MWDHQGSADPAVDQAGRLGVAEGQIGAQGSFEEIDDPVVAAARPQAEARDLDVRRSLLGRRGEQGQQGQAGLGQTDGHLETEAGCGHLHGTVHERCRFLGVGGRTGLDSVAGSGDDVRAGRVRPQHRLDRTLVQPLAPRKRDLGVHRLPQQVVLEGVAAGPRLTGLDEEAGVHGRVERLDHELLACVEQVAQAIQLHLTPEHRGGGQGGERLVVELLEPVPQDAPQPGGKLRAEPPGSQVVRPQVPEHLTGEERVPPGPLPQRLHERTWGFVAVPLKRRHQLAEVVWTEGRQRHGSGHLVDAAAAQQSGEGPVPTPGRVAEAHEHQ